MATGNVRAHRPTVEKLRRLREQSGEPTADLLEEAVDLLERERFLDVANSAFARLRDDPDQWGEEVRERSLWEGTLADDLSLDR
jgi:hypothetical protein